jgi:hypothetical protein
MLHVLAVSRDGPRDLAAPASFEVLWAHSAEDAVEKLARNRRIDAVLFFDDATARETAGLLAGEGGAAPPLFQEGGSGAGRIVALRRIDLFDELRQRLGG